MPPNMLGHFSSGGGDYAASRATRIFEKMSSLANI